MYPSAKDGRDSTVTSGEQVWSANVDGEARGLAVADGRLLVSTTAGKIYCSGKENGLKANHACMDYEITVKYNNKRKKAKSA